MQKQEGLRSYYKQRLFKTCRSIAKDKDYVPPVSENFWAKLRDEFMRHDTDLTGNIDRILVHSAATHLGVDLLETIGAERETLGSGAKKKSTTLDFEAFSSAILAALGHTPSRLLPKKTYEQHLLEANAEASSDPLLKARDRFVISDVMKRAMQQFIKHDDRRCFIINERDAVGEAIGFVCKGLHLSEYRRLARPIADRLGIDSIFHYRVFVRVTARSETEKGDASLHTVPASRGSTEMDKKRFFFLKNDAHRTARETRGGDENLVKEKNEFDLRNRLSARRSVTDAQDTHHESLRILEDNPREIHRIYLARINGQLQRFQRDFKDNPEKFVSNANAKIESLIDSIAALSTTSARNLHSMPIGLHDGTDDAKEREVTEFINTSADMSAREIIVIENGSALDIMDFVCGSRDLLDDADIARTLDKVQENPALRAFLSAFLLPVRNALNAFRIVSDRLPSNKKDLALDDICDLVSGLVKNVPVFGGLVGSILGWGSKPNLMENRRGAVIFKKGSALLHTRLKSETGLRLALHVICQWESELLETKEEIAKIAGEDASKIALDFLRSGRVAIDDGSPPLEDQLRDAVLTGDNKAKVFRSDFFLRKGLKLEDQEDRGLLAGYLREIQVYVLGTNLGKQQGRPFVSGLNIESVPIKYFTEAAKLEGKARTHVENKPLHSITCKESMLLDDMARMHIDTNKKAKKLLMDPSKYSNFLDEEARMKLSTPQNFRYEILWLEGPDRSQVQNARKYCRTMQESDPLFPNAAALPLSLIEKGQRPLKFFLAINPR